MPLKEAPDSFWNDCRNIWGQNPLDRPNPLCVYNRKRIDAEATAALSKPKEEGDGKKGAKTETKEDKK